MHPPPQLVQWLKQSYPKPSIDENWLQQCYAWVIEEHNLSPATDMDKIKEHVESQLLMSDLTDSMIAGSGLPHNLIGVQKGSLAGPPTLVQIVALTEIGHSAFSLMNVRQTKIDRADLSGLAGGDNEDEAADEGPVPNYPRSMLQFELSDGAIKLNAIEYRKIPQIDLENTPLGFKMQLKDVTIRQGIAFLEPRNVVLKGYNVEDLDMNRDSNFLKGLRLRMDPNAQDEPEGDGANVEDQQALVPAPVPAPVPTVRRAIALPIGTRSDVADVPRTAQPRLVNRPLQAVGPIPVPGPSDLTTRSLIANENDRRRRPRPLARSNAPRPGPSTTSISSGNSAVATSTRTISPDFSIPGGAAAVAPMRLSPTRETTAPLDDDSPEPGSDWYFAHDGIDAAFLSRAASELERSDALLSSQSQSSQSPFPMPSQLQPPAPPHEVIFVDDRDHGDNFNEQNAFVRPGRGTVRRMAQRQVVRLDGSVIDLSTEIIDPGPRRIQPPPLVDNGDVISIGSDD